MRFQELIFEGKSIKNQRKIMEILEREGFDWLVDSETENAKIEIKKNTLIWHDGYFLGDWYYGIFKSGEFHGNFENGIFESGDFKGNFLSGLKL
jgi:hypothetical protein